MGGTAYIALSGLRSRFEQFDRLAADLSNSQTAGYKAERGSMETATRPAFDELLQTAVDVRAAKTKTDFRGGETVPTGRDLDVALSGPGFFVVGTAGGERYTRTGHFMRSSDGTLVSGDGSPVLGDAGPIKLGSDPVTFAADGTISSSKGVLGKLRVASFENMSSLKRVGHTQFQTEETPQSGSGTVVQGGALEQSNVSVIERVAEMTEVARGFEALQRGMSLLMNDLDGRAIGELGRR